MLYKTDQGAIKSYFEDSSNLKGGYADQVVVPENIDELSAFIGMANRDKTPLTISGGGTSTTGSRIPFGGAVLSLERLNRIIDVSVSDMRASLQAGASVDELKKAVESVGLFYASHPTESNASVGGTVATNASGSRSFKYGPTRNYVMRLKMVLADGSILDLRRGDVTLSRNGNRIAIGKDHYIEVPIPAYVMPEAKSSSGYYAKNGMDAIDLFIAQEGTLSVIAEIELALVKRPYKILSSFVFFNKEEDAWRFAIGARDLSKANRIDADSAGINALSMEYFDSYTLSLLRPKYPNIPDSARSAIFFEQDASSTEEEDLILKQWLEHITKCGASVDDTWVAMTEKEAQKFTGLRYAVPEAVNESVRKYGFRKFSTDIAVPDARSYEMMRFYSDTFMDISIEHLIFGHLGENHVHVNIIPKTDREAATASDIIMRFVKKGVSLGGAVSAEHGIGKLKHKYLEEMYGVSGVREMAKIKKAFDPNCILGLGNIFARELLNY